MATTQNSITMSAAGGFSAVVRKSVAEAVSMSAVSDLVGTSTKVHAPASLTLKNFTLSQPSLRSVRLT